MHSLSPEEKRLDLQTGDGKAHRHFLKSGIQKVQISVYGWYEHGDKPIYLLRILE